MPKTTRADLEALVARAGLTASKPQLDGLHAVWDGLEAMQASIRQPIAGPEAEPATTFSTEPGR